MEEKNEKFKKLSNRLEEELNTIRNKDMQMGLQLKELDEIVIKLQVRLQELEKRKLEFPKNTVKLKTAIEREFSKRGIKSKVYIVAELLEIIDEEWKNAVEGYFNTQKFNLIVEPEYYPIALHVYHRNQNEIHTAGIVNTRKIKLDMPVNNQTLAYVVKSENRYAKAYANYVLGRVIRCNNVDELEKHKIAMTADCMLYQGFVVRNLDRETYRNPYIGQYAYQVQLINTREEFEKQVSTRAKFRREKEKLANILEVSREFNPKLMYTYLHAPLHVQNQRAQLEEEKIRLKEASNDPTLIELNMQIERNEELHREKEDEKNKLSNQLNKLLLQKEERQRLIGSLRMEQKELESRFHEKADENNECRMLAEDKYKQNRKSKTPKNIVDNFNPQKSQFSNEREQLLHGKEGLYSLQETFNNKHEQDFLRGTEGMRDYIDAKKNLEAVELVRFEERLKKAKEDCEQIFKQDFLAKMRNNIENARNEFKNLNKALQDIYYGEDSYHFIITYDKKKESLYRMITSENNQEGYSLWTQAFEAEYKEEMADLFAKLTTKDDKGDKVIKEYTDYRAYLDYDIEIRKKNGKVQKFSAIYGEKSGSETQVPYYVAIAASFYQLYRFGNTTRVMLLDEAFDKMDDERINSMVEFFNSLELQVLMATPPAKIEIIGERVNTILTAIRVGDSSIVEEYDL